MICVCMCDRKEEGRQTDRTDGQAVPLHYWKNFSLEDLFYSFLSLLSSQIGRWWCPSPWHVPRKEKHGFGFVLQFLDNGHNVYVVCECVCVWAVTFSHLSISDELLRAHLSSLLSLNTLDISSHSLSSLLASWPGHFLGTLTPPLGAEEDAWQAVSLGATPPPRACTCTPGQFGLFAFLLALEEPSLPGPGGWEAGQGMGRQSSSFFSAVYPHCTACPTPTHCVYLFVPFCIALPHTLPSHLKL